MTLLSNILNKIKKTGFKNSLAKAVNYLRGLYYRSFFTKCGPLQVTGRIFIHKKHAKIIIGKCLIWKHAKFDMEGESKDNPAVLEIGDFSTIGDRTEIHVAEKVIIGKRCTIAWDCVIMDRNYHGIGNEIEKVEPVVIENDVWLGCRVIVLPGVTIGKKSLVAAGSVVTKNVTAYTLVAGNPARFVKNINERGKSFTFNR